MTIISHKHRFIFLRTEKTGGTSFSAALRALLDDSDLCSDMKRPGWAKYSPIHHGALKRDFPKWFGLHTHAKASQVREVVGPKVFDSYFKFAIERNPWDRQVSLYFHREWKKKNANPDFSKDMGSLLYRSTEYVRLNNWAIYAIGDTIVADRVLRYENLDIEVGALIRDLGIELPLDLPRLRSYAPNRAHYSTFYNDATRNLVAQWYRKEIDALGYTFEEPSSNAEALTDKAA